MKDVRISMVGHDREIAYRVMSNAYGSDLLRISSRSSCG